MKTIIIILSLITAISFTSCKKYALSANTSANDTIDVHVTAVTSIRNADTVVLVVNSNPLVQTLFATCNVTYSVYDSTSFKYYKTDNGVAIPGAASTEGPVTKLDTISTTLIKPDIQNVIIDTVNYSPSSVPNHIIVFNY